MAVFLSYLREDRDNVRRLREELENAGIDVWQDRTSIPGGARWSEAIRAGIADASFFIACFSDQYAARKRSYMNVELTQAIEHLQERSHETIWFIPVRFSDCEIPARPIGAGETLDKFESIDLFDDWKAGVQRLLAAMLHVQPHASIDSPPQSVPAPPLRNVAPDSSPRRSSRSSVYRFLLWTGLGVVGAGIVGWPVVAWLASLPESVATCSGLVYDSSSRLVAGASVQVNVKTKMGLDEVREASNTDETGRFAVLLTDVQSGEAAKLRVQKGRAQAEKTFYAGASCGDIVLKERVDVASTADVSPMVISPAPSATAPLPVDAVPVPVRAAPTKAAAASPKRPRTERPVPPECRERPRDCSNELGEHLYYCQKDELVWRQKCEKRP